MNKMEKHINAPLLIIAFNRPDISFQTFKYIRDVKPIKLYIAVDGAREGKEDEGKLIEQVKSILQNIDWPCETHYRFNEENRGAEVTISTAISWVFETEEYAIILEDDIIASLILIPYSIYILRKFTAFNIRLNAFLRELKVATPLILASYAYVPITNVDRIFLERLDNLAELGLYSIGVTIAGYAQLALTALVMAFEPDIFESVVKKNRNKLIKTAAIIYLPYFIFIFIFILFSGSIINLLTAGRYPGAQPYTNIALVGVFFMGLYGLFDKILIALEKTKFNLMINIIGGISALLIFYFGIKEFGFYGAAYGKVAVALLMVIIGFMLVRIKYKFA